MNKIYFDSLLGLTDEERANTKLKFNVYSVSTGVNPIDVFLSDPEGMNNDWMLHRTKRKDFRTGQIVINLVKLDWNTWLLTSIKRITKELDVTDDIGYEAEPICKYEGLFGRVVVEYHKTELQGIMWFDTVNEYERLVIKQILPSVFKNDGFPGYDNVCISRKRLMEIIEHKEKDWINALQAQKGVYVITDTNNGKLYVGSAYGSYGLLGRWQNYKDTVHGGNQGLVDLYEKEGQSYFDEYFQYSILEIFNSLTSDETIIAREQYWKQVLNSRVSGYNKN